MNLKDVGLGFGWGFVVASYLLADVTPLAMWLIFFSVAAYVYGYVFDEMHRLPEIPEEGSS